MKNISQRQTLPTGTRGESDFLIGRIQLMEVVFFILSRVHLVKTFFVLTSNLCIYLPCMHTRCEQIGNRVIIRILQYFAVLSNENAENKHHCVRQEYYF